MDRPLKARGNPKASAPFDPSHPRPPESTCRASALSALLRPELSELRSYAGVPPPGVLVKLDANEAPASRSPAVREVVARAIANVALERYPDPRALRLKEAIGSRTGARPEDLLVGSGSDEIIALLLTALARPRPAALRPVVLTLTPTFVMYRVTARGQGHDVVEVPLDADWDIDVDATVRSIEAARPNVIFVASPNNPTGNRVDDGRLLALLDAAAGVGAFVVLDEAYVDYSARGSLRHLRGKHPHLGVLRTLSKVGLAALRVGWLEADGTLIAEIDKVRQPFNVSAISQAAASAVLEEAWQDVLDDVATLACARDVLAKAIDALDGFAVTPSSANFLWVKTTAPAREVRNALLREGVLVRSFHESGGRLATQLRITVGTDADNDALLAALRHARGSL